MEVKEVWAGGTNSAWLFPLSQPEEIIDELSSYLTNNELAQANSFGKPELRIKFLVRRGMLRHLMGQLLQRQPEDIQFQSEPFGKPVVIGEPIHFSASSSNDYGIVAFSLDGAVGVDIEHHNSILISDDFALYTDSETAALRQAKETPELFFRIWARKEACVKATGQGIRYQLRDLDVLPYNSDSCIVHAPNPILIRDLIGPEGYSCALAIVQK